MKTTKVWIKHVGDNKYFQIGQKKKLFIKKSFFDMLRLTFKLLYFNLIIVNIFFPCTSTSILF